MKTESLNSLRKHLSTLSSMELAQLCVDMAKYRKENKEYLQYLLFERHDHDILITDIVTSLDETMKNLSRTPSTRVKEVRKVQKEIKKYIRFIKNPVYELQLLLWFSDALALIAESRIARPHFISLYAAQVKRMTIIFDKLHEDIQYDYRDALQHAIARDLNAFNRS